MTDAPLDRCPEEVPSSRSDGGPLGMNPCCRERGHQGRHRTSYGKAWDDAPLDLRALACGWSPDCPAGDSFEPHSECCDDTYAVLVRVHAQGWRGGTVEEKEAVAEFVSDPAKYEVEQVYDIIGDSANSEIAADIRRDVPLVPPPEQPK